MNITFNEHHFKSSRNIFTELDEIIKEQNKFKMISETIFYPSDEEGSSSQKLELEMKANEKSMEVFNKTRENNYDAMEKCEIEITHSNLEDIIKDIKNPNSTLSFEEVRFYHYMFGINTDPNQVLAYTLLDNSIRRQSHVTQLNLDTLMLYKEVIHGLKDFVKSFKVPLGDMDEPKFEKHLTIITNAGNKIRELQNYIDKSDLKLKISEDINS